MRKMHFENVCLGPPAVPLIVESTYTAYFWGQYIYVCTHMNEHVAQWLTRQCDDITNLNYNL